MDERRDDDNPSKTVEVIQQSSEGYEDYSKQVSKVNRQDTGLMMYGKDEDAKGNSEKQCSGMVALVNPDSTHVEDSDTEGDKLCEIYIVDPLR